MDYNTSRKKLVLPEYGRNIQKMVNYLLTIEDREKRNKEAKAVIQVLANLNPHFKETADFKDKLWDHLALMSNFQLDIDYPYEPVKPEELNKKPNKIPYTNGKIRYKHYGKTVQKFIETASDMDDSPEKDLFVKNIANHMKKLYLTWNRESITDEMIFSDILELSQGNIKIQPGEMKLVDTKDLIYRNNNNNNNNYKSNRKNRKRK
ncbi:MAG: DUF4290 domain-containing protein [Marinilabiliales bacterium]|nr:MAG: DUF4290 domain-containing protein [Marinilabiliales bacterium]